MPGLKWITRNEYRIAQAESRRVRKEAMGLGPENPGAGKRTVRRGSKALLQKAADYKNLSA